MLDINLGNKTLFVGVLIALILSYGMINFDSTPTNSRTIAAISTSVQAGAPSEPAVATANAETGDSVHPSVPPAGGTQPMDDAARLRMERREQRRLERL